MARTNDMFLARAVGDDAPYEGELDGEVFAIRSGEAVYGIAGADGQAEAARKAAEEARAQAEASRVSAEEARAVSQASNDERQAANDAAQAANNAAAQGLLVVVLGDGEYDPSTLEPTADGAAGRVYLAPDGAGGYAEWLWVDGAWDRLGGGGEVPRASEADVDAVAAGEAPRGSQVLDLTGLSRLWDKSGLDGVSWPLPVALGGTGAADAAGARGALGAVGLGNDAADASAWCDPEYQQRACVTVEGTDGERYALIARDGSIGLYRFGDSSGYVWQQGMGGNVATPPFNQNLGGISDASWEKLYNINPGSRLINKGATNSPNPGYYGNATISRAGGNRVSALATFDDGTAWVTTGAQATNGAVAGWRQLPSIADFEYGQVKANTTWWAWRKYADGFCEMWGNVRVPGYQMTSVDYSGSFYYGPTVNIEYPFNLWWSGVSAMVMHDPGLYGMNVKNVLTTGFGVLPWGNATRTLDLDVSVSVTGFWKNLGDW